MKIFSIFSIIFFCFFSSVLLSQSPGGVSGHELWEKDFEDVHMIRDYDNSNFNSNNYLEIPLNEFTQSYSLGDFSRYTIFLVYKFEHAGSIARIQTGNKTVEIKGDRVIGKSIFPLKTVSKASKILMFKGQGKRDSRKKIEPSLTFGLIDPSQNYSDEDYLCVSEVILYDRILNSHEIDRVESYLSIKYGISLPLHSTYYDSDGAMIIDSILTAEYPHHVTGIGKDIEGNLKTYQSSNAAQYNFLKIGIKDIQNEVKTDAHSIADKSYLLWSDNGGELSFENEPLEIDGIGKRNDLQNENTQSIRLSILDRKWVINQRTDLLLDHDLNMKINIADLKNFDKESKLYAVLSAEQFDSKNLDDYHLFPINVLAGYGELFDLDKKALNTNQTYLTIVQISQKGPESISKNIRIEHDNPVLASQRFEIKITDDSTISGLLQISTIGGEIISSQAIKNEERTITVPVVLGSAGIYIISYVKEDTTISSKLIVT